MNEDDKELSQGAIQETNETDTGFMQTNLSNSEAIRSPKSHQSPLELAEYTADVPSDFQYSQRHTEQLPNVAEFLDSVPSAHPILLDRLEQQVPQPQSIPPITSTPEATTAPAHQSFSLPGIGELGESRKRKLDSQTPIEPDALVHQPLHADLRTTASGVNPPMLPSNPPISTTAVPLDAPAAQAERQMHDSFRNSGAHEAAVKRWCGGWELNQHRMNIGIDSGAQASVAVDSQQPQTRFGTEVNAHGGASAQGSMWLGNSIPAVNDASIDQVMGVNQGNEVCGALAVVNQDGAARTTAGSWSPPPNSALKLVLDLQRFLRDVASKPRLANDSASFMRDFLRTLLVQSSAEAQASIDAQEQIELRQGKRQNLFSLIPVELVKHVFNFLDGSNLARARQICRKWNQYCCDEQVWKRLCLREWRSLATDSAAWPLADSMVCVTDSNKWRKIYPSLANGRKWRCRLQKTGRFICHMVAHQVSGQPLGDQGMPETLVVERRFNILHLQTFVLPDAAVLYFEPEAEKDRAGFEDFIDYLTKRTRAGLALDEQRRFIFIPPCDYSKEQLEYKGKSLLGVVQNAFPPLAA